MTGVLRRGDQGMDTHGGKMMQTDTERRWPSPRGGEMPSGKSKPANSLILDFQPPHHEEINFWVERRQSGLGSLVLVRDHKVGARAETRAQPK